MKKNILIAVLAVFLLAVSVGVASAYYYGPGWGDNTIYYAPLVPEPEPPKPEFPKWAVFTVGDKRYYSAPAGQEMWENRPYLFERYSHAAEMVKYEKKADVAPFIESNRTYIPMRYLAYALGATDKDVTWDGATRTVRLVLRTAADPEKTVTVTMKIGSRTLYRDGQAVAMDVAPLIRNGRAFLPARFVAEAAGYAVSWDEDYRGALVGPPGKMPVHPERVTPPDQPEAIIGTPGGEVVPDGIYW